MRPFMCPFRTFGREASAAIVQQPDQRLKTLGVLVQQERRQVAVRVLRDAVGGHDAQKLRGRVLLCQDVQRVAQKSAIRHPASQWQCSQ